MAGPAPVSGAGTETDETAGVRFRAASARLSRIWWNQPRYVEPLGLTAEQRSAMDALLMDHLERRRELARDLLESRRSLGDHLATGDWDAAEKASVRLGEAFSAIARAEGELAVGVTRLLQPRQRTRIDEDFPLLLRRPWVSGGLGVRSRSAERFRERAATGPPGSH